MTATGGVEGRRPLLERRLTLRQRLAAGVGLGLLATSACWLGVTWLDAQTPDPPGFDGTMLLIAALGLVLGAVVSWAVLGGVEQRVAELAACALALAEGRPADPPRPVGHGALADLGAGLRGIAARLAAQGEQLRELGEQRDRLTAPLREAAAQEERNRLARDLHDTIKQQLFSIGVTAAAAEARWGAAPDSARAAIGEIRALAGAAQVEMRALLTQLRPVPVATIGLLAALQEQLDALAHRAEVAVEADLRPLPEGVALAPGAEDALFRIAQEALANIARHARARHVRASLGLATTGAHGAAVELIIGDDGQGFDPQAAASARGMGWQNMRARAAAIGATLDLVSRPAGGTTLTVRVPVYQAPPAPRQPAAPPPDRRAAALRRHAAARLASTILGGLFGWFLVYLLPLGGGSPTGVAWPVPPAALALAPLLGAIVTGFWADQLGRRFRASASVGDARVWSLRLARTDQFSRALDLLLGLLIVPLLVPSLRPLILVGGGLALLWSLRRLVRTERALTRLAPRWATRALLEQERGAQVTNLTTYLVIFVVSNSLARIRIPSRVETVEQWARASLSYPLILLIAVAAWGFAWNTLRLRQVPAAPAADPPGVG